MTCENCQSLQQERDALQAKCVDLSQKWHAINTILAEKEQELQGVRLNRERELERDPSSERVRAICDHWLDRTWSGRGRKPGTPLSGERAAKVRAQLKHKHPDEITRAIDGYAAFPYVVEAKREAKGKPDDRFVDLELICRSEKTVENGLKLADRKYKEFLERCRAEAKRLYTDHDELIYPHAHWRTLFALKQAGCSPKRLGDSHFQALCPYCRKCQTNVRTHSWGFTIIHCPSCQEGNWVTEEVDQSGWAEQLGLVA